MNRGVSRILTTHAGARPRPDDLLALNAERTLGSPLDTVHRARLRSAVQDVVDRQTTLGLDIFDALNHALDGIPEHRVRYHMCRGSWHGPHLTDIPLRDIVDLLLTIRAGGYSLEAGNVRHEHEWKVWRDLTLPPEKVLIPGVVSHATNVVEHPELVADRIVQYAQVVGREHVMAGTDCGLGGRIHPSLAWAKLQVLVEGAALASRQLWRT